MPTAPKQDNETETLKRIGRCVGDMVAIQKGSATKKYLNGALIVNKLLEDNRNVPVTERMIRNCSTEGTVEVQRAQTIFNELGQFAIDGRISDINQTVVH